MAKGVRSILFLLHTSSHLLTPYSDAILDALIVAKRLILEQSNRDIRFLATINLKSVMNKSIRYSKPLCSSSLFRGRSTQRARSKLLYDSVFLFAALLSPYRLYRQLLRVCCYSDRCVARVFDDDRLSRVFYGDSFRQCEQNQSVHDDFEGIFHDHQPKSGLFHSLSLAFRANNVLLSLQRSTHFVQVDSPSAPIQTLHVPRLFVSFASKDRDSVHSMQLVDPVRSLLDVSSFSPSRPYERLFHFSRSKQSFHGDEQHSFSFG